MIRGTPSNTGTYIIQIVSTNSETGKLYQEFITFVVEPRPPTLANSQREIDLSVLFADVEDSAVVVTLEMGDALDTVGLSYNPETKMITGTRLHLTPTRSRLRGLTVMAMRLQKNLSPVIMSRISPPLRTLSRNQQENHLNR